MATIIGSDGYPLLCYHSACQEIAGSAYNTAPVFNHDGSARVYVHCSYEHLAATVATNQDFTDEEPEGDCPLCDGQLYGLYPAVCNKCGCDVGELDE